MFISFLKVFITKLKIEKLMPSIKNFFDNYKVLQKVEVTTGKYHGKHAAMKIIEECRARYKAAQG